MLGECSTNTNSLKVFSMVRIENYPDHFEDD